MSGHETPPRPGLPAGGAIGRGWDGRLTGRSVRWATRTSGSPVSLRILNSEIQPQSTGILGHAQKTFGGTPSISDQFVL